MNLDEIAIDLLEQNDYDAALSVFQQAVEKSRDVQPLTNLAWVLTNEEHDSDQAIELLLEVVQMKSISYFPYNLLGEVYMRKEMWQEASTVLKQSISIEPTIESTFNLGATMYHLGNLDEAANFYLASAGNSDYALYGYVRCLINLGKMTEAKQILNTFSEEADDFVGEIEVAEFYVELNCYEEAVHWYKKGFESYYPQASWVGRYIYSLLQLGWTEKAKEIQVIALNHKMEELKEEKEEACDEHWTEQDKQKGIQKLWKEIATYEQIAGWISTKSTPAIAFDSFDSFDPSISPRCYLFGYKRHNYPEYAEKGIP